MVHIHSAVVKVAALVGAVQIVGGAVAESDNERRQHPGLWGPLVGAIKGVGNVFLGTGNAVGYILGRIIPPRNPHIDLPHLLEGAVVALTGPAFLGLLFTSIYYDARDRGELGNFNVEY